MRAVPVLLLLAALACGSGGSNDDDDTIAVDDDDDDIRPDPAPLDLSELQPLHPDAPEAFVTLHAEILEPTCAVIGCHEGSTSFGNVSLTSLNFETAEGSHRQLVGRNSIHFASWKRVAPGEPEHSYLLAKLMQVDWIEGAPMPAPPLPRLPQSDIARIAAWIDAGAPLDIE